MSDINSQYAEDGFYIGKSLLSENQCEEIKTDLAAMINGKYGDYPFQSIKESLGFDNLNPEELYKKVLCIHHPHALSDVILSYMKAEQVTSVLKEVIGPCVKAMQSMMFIKGPGLQGQSWHQDEYYIPTRDRSLCGVWIALDDATIENGCLWVLKGSHKKGYLYPMQDHNDTENFDNAQTAFGFDDHEEVPVQLKKGDVLFFNGYLLHRSKKNKSKNSFRRALVCHYMNSFSLLPWGRDSYESASSSGSADNRKVIQVLGDDPYEWKGRSMENQVYCRKYEPAVTA